MGRPRAITRFFGLVVLARVSERDEVNLYTTRPFLFASEICVSLANRSTSTWLGKLIDLVHLQKFLSPLLILIFSKIEKKIIFQQLLISPPNFSGHGKDMEKNED